jgi:hypothetical protein
MNLASDWSPWSHPQPFQAIIPGLITLEWIVLKSYEAYAD